MLPQATAAAGHPGRGADLPQVAALMGVFGLGAALPVLGLAYASRAGLARSRSALLKAGQAGKGVLGAMLLLVAAMILLGLDKRAEAWLVDKSPAWLTELTTRF